MSLDLPVFAQEYTWTCLPACIRMVLAYHGKSYSESDIATVCHTVPLRGTQPENALDGLETLGYRALWFEDADLQRLMDLVDHRWPVIVFLRSSDLPHGTRGFHAVVVVGFQNNDVQMADPVLAALSELSLSRFLKAWQALGAQGMVIWP